ncbi:hypothetical protein BAE29_10380 [Acidithiobacillus caldus]|jgi:putative CRISPR-associated protein (TIGR02619 family)|uniref:CRISPR system ring nuclease SSO1393-like domain-containing protein n=2 Tax=Acidithiobacillus caldus TaxID=33059 RepID=A0A1E7YKU5_9PROT|nr:hypothetical protein BAE27_11975 [Acidithiobacillus caldus]OFC37600.1 hypothetical protein BAE29_10380 [Acidithiobacillus caldus]OFC39187.1 hypothetical protein BAE28_04175 [Acidithiobacillus caldus]
MRYIVTPCGTSLLTNIGRGTNGLIAIINQYSNEASADRVPADPRAQLKTLLGTARERLQNESRLDELRKMSAEINGLTRLYEHGWPAGNDIHFLIATDTWLGRETAQCIRDWLESRGQSVQIAPITDLSTHGLATFQSGMAELVHWCAETLAPLRTSGTRVVFQLSGGFKSVQGFLQTLAHFYADETVYIFEKGDELLRIPRLPVRLDLEGMVREHFSLLARLADKLVVDSQEVSALPETLIQVDDGKAAFSVWGDLVWDQVGKPLLGEIFRASPSAKLRYGPSFLESTQELSPDRLALVNTRIGDLARFLETGINLNRLDFKALAGNPRPPSTHECDAWADRDAKRLFGHYEGEVYVLDALGNALH